MNISPIFRKEFRTEFIRSMFVALSMLVIIIASWNIVPSHPSQSFAFMFLFWNLLLFFLGFPGLVYLIPHHRLLSIIFETELPEEMVITIEAKVGDDGVTEYTGNFELPNQPNRKHVFSVNIFSSKLLTLPPKSIVKVYYSKSRGQKGPIIIEVKGELYWPKVLSWPSSQYIL